MPSPVAETNLSQLPPGCRVFIHPGEAEDLAALFLHRVRTIACAKLPRAAAFYPFTWESEYRQYKARCSNWESGDELDPIVDAMLLAASNALDDWRQEGP